MKTQSEMQAAAKQFAENWNGKGDEKQETQRYWMQLLGEVLGVFSPASYIEFEKRVKRNVSHSELDSESTKEMLNQVQHDSTTNFIDAYIPETKVLIEQKGIKIDLNKAYEQSDGTLLTPYEQAKRYVNDMKASEKPRWIVVCNFAEFDVYDLENPQNPPEIIFLKDLEKDYYRLEFLVDRKNENLRKEVEISVAAGNLVGKLYDSLVKEYINPEAPESARSLNILCVRLVFCFYAEDAGLFATRTSFEDYIKSFNLPNIREGLIKLFKALDTKTENRDKYDVNLQPFPYVNGGLFHDENIEIPNFTEEIVDVLVNYCAPFDWSEISPTIFGAVFESTLNPETRRKGGMHYTSIQNIHKVIDPLFLDELNEEFNVIASGAKQSQKQKTASLIAFQEKLGSLTFLDPACGSGNFLTETYISLRRLENKVISVLNKGEKVLGFDEFIKVKINQFYGIEINDFAVTVAKTALWIAESQMINETEKIVSQQIDFLPLKEHANIIEGNALRMDWSTLSEVSEYSGFVFAEKLNVYKIDDNFGNVNVQESVPVEYGKQYKELNVVTKQVENKELPKKEEPKPIEYDYIIGNPPFIGYTFQSERQKDDLKNLNATESKNIDYVAGWFFKASKLIQGKKTKCSFVATNSITQGEQVSEIWKPILENNIYIDFAWRTFKWSNETTDKEHMAAVHCVIVGFSCHADSELLRNSSNNKFIFTENGEKISVKNINPYLLDAPTVFIEKRKTPLCDVSKINKGSQPTDGGNLIIEADEYDDFIKKEPEAKKFVRQFIGADEFINNKKRYCLWLVDASPAEMRKLSLVKKRIEKVKEMRLSSSKEATRNWAAYPYLFTENRQPESGNYLLIPRVSSENRSYVPIGFLSSNVIASDAVQIVPNATLYEFGILTSSVHMAWMRAVCGRLKSDYRYSNDIVYNNFVWCNSTVEQKKKIEQTAQAILDAREKYPNSSFADLYDETLMPIDLRKAHEANDKAVMQAYGFKANASESEIVAELFKMYEKLAEKQ